MEEKQLADVSAARLQLKAQVKQVQEEMSGLKRRYDSLLKQSALREESVRGQSLKPAVTSTSKDEEERRSVHDNPAHMHQTTPVQPPASLSSELQKLTCRRSRRVCSPRSAGSGETVLTFLQACRRSIHPAQADVLH